MKRERERERGRERARKRKGRRDVHEKGSCRQQKNLYANTVRESRNGHREELGLRNASISINVING